ncbi:hypothetical protein LMG28727_04896 [Paraburkholderia kirstenboschensis]|uniref:hypothetical protein n=1 Tax=Paraburkholderia kirstenboschensis TaxID=1245436 RepID=UPI001918CA01|nr:hypothetical protein [Paraburkholderia kirstenboschensis]CAD6548818.1 hypothetical protein LMG28727_04896 [Paraburkholderia kirstenboschensis]
MAKRKHSFPAGYDRHEGKYLLVVGKDIIAGPFTSFDEAHHAKTERFPSGRQPESGQRVEVSYSPTTRDTRRWDRLDRTLRALDVQYWCVVEDRKTERGRCIGYPLSRKYSTRQECRAALARIKGSNPRAYIGGGTCFFHWARPEDMQTRRVLLAEIRCP